MVLISMCLLTAYASDVAYFKKLKIPANTPMLRYTRCELEIYEAMRHGRYNAAAGLCEKLTTMVDPAPTPCALSSNRMWGDPAVWLL